MDQKRYSFACKGFKTPRGKCGTNACSYQKTLKQKTGEKLRSMLRGQNLVSSTVGRGYGRLLQNTWWTEKANEERKIKKG